MFICLYVYFPLLPVSVSLPCLVANDWTSLELVGLNVTYEAPEEEEVQKYLVRFLPFKEARKIKTDNQHHRQSKNDSVTTKWQQL